MTAPWEAPWNRFWAKWGGSGLANNPNGIGGVSTELGAPDACIMTEERSRRSDWVSCARRAVGAEGISLPTGAAGGGVPSGLAIQRWQSATGYEGGQWLQGKGHGWMGGCVVKGSEAQGGYQGSTVRVPWRLGACKGASTARADGMGWREGV